MGVGAADCGEQRCASIFPSESSCVGGVVPRRELPGLYRSSTLGFGETFLLFSTEAEPDDIATIARECSFPSVPFRPLLTITGYFRPSELCYSHWCEMTTHCHFDLQVPDYNCDFFMSLWPSILSSLRCSCSSPPNFLKG